MKRNRALDEIELEQMIDHYGLRDVFEMIESICHEKSDHIRASYDDIQTAISWTRASVVAGRASAQKHVIEVSS